MLASKQQSPFHYSTALQSSSGVPAAYNARKATTKASPTKKEPIFVSLCFLGAPCRWHCRRAKRCGALLAKLKDKYVMIPVCPEQLGGIPTPCTSETLRDGTSAQV